MYFILELKIVDFFFVIWNIIGVVLFCNILIANIIDYLVWSWEVTNAEEEEKKQKELAETKKKNNYSFSENDIVKMQIKEELIKNI